MGGLLGLSIQVTLILLLDMCDGFDSRRLGEKYFQRDEVMPQRFVKQLTSRGYLSQQARNLWDGNYETDQAQHKGRVLPSTLPSYATDTPDQELGRMARRLVTRMKSKQELDDRSGTWKKAFTNPRWLAGGPIIDGQVLGTGCIYAYTQGRPVELDAAQSFKFNK